MRAAVFKKAGAPLSIEAVPDPTPGEGGVVIKVARCGICSSDLHMTEGHGITAAPNSVLGHEISGEIVAIGADVSNIKRGDRVTALPLSGCGQCDFCLAGQARWCEQFIWRAGGYAEYVLAAAHSCRKLPAALSMADGALVEPLAVALNAVKRANLQPGARVVIVGAGPIGLATAYWAKQFGASGIAVSAASHRRAALAEQMGATSFFVNDENAAQTAAQQLGGLPDVVFECVGMPGMIDRSIDLVKTQGTIVVAGFCMGADTFYPAKAMSRHLTMQFAMLYSTADFQQSVDSLDAGRVEPRAMITDTVSLEQFPQAFEALRVSTPQCKVQLAPWD